MDRTTHRTDARDWMMTMSQDDVSMTYADDAAVTAAGMFGGRGIFILQLLTLGQAAYVLMLPVQIRAK